MKTVYVLRTRMDDSEPWSEPAYFKTRRERDKEAAINRIIGGVRTWSFEQKVSKQEAGELIEA